MIQYLLEQINTLKDIVLAERARRPKGIGTDKFGLPIFGPFPKPDGILGSLGASGRTNEERTTLGIHVHGKLASIPGLQYAGEFAVQFGSINGDGVRNLDIENAYGGYAQISYTKENWNWKPQIG